MASLSPIQNFYKDAHVLVTGGTGFLGKVLLEKLLYSCTGVAKVYLIIRCKKGKNEETRLKELLNDVVYQRLREERPECLNKVVMVPGDCSLPNLGVTQEDRELLVKNVTVVFHGAATVRFDENLKLACAINVNGTKEVINMCRRMKNLKAFVHTSTAYSNSNRIYIEEKFYEPPSCSTRLLDIASVLTQEEIAKITPDLLESWPNTYTFTKAMAEHFVKHEEGIIPACVFRPAMVTSSYKEPLPGWIDNVYGPVGLTVGSGCGVIHVVHADLMNSANIVPVDLVVNAILVAALETHKSFKSGDTEIKIYNYESTTDNHLCWKDYMYLIELEGLKMPSEKAIWYYSLIITRFYPIYLLLAAILHFLPAYIIDLGALLLGKQPQMVRAYQKVSKFSQTLSFFALKKFKFANDNVRQLLKSMTEEDKMDFNMDIKTIDWHNYLTSYIAGARLYILKEPVDNLPKAKIRWRRLYWLHQGMKALVMFLFGRFLYSFLF